MRIMRAVASIFFLAILSAANVRSFVIVPTTITRVKMASRYSISPGQFDEHAGVSFARRNISQVLIGSIGWVSLACDANAEFPFMAGVVEKRAAGGVAPTKRVNGPAQKIRKNVGLVMDELQRDLMQERWDLVEAYPAQLRSYVPVFTTYTDAAFPSDIPTDKGLRIALRYEVGRFFASVERLKQATSRKALNEGYVAYGEMSLHLDRYMRVGGLYTYYDDNITLEPYFAGITESTLSYSDPSKDPPEVRDLIIICQGPDKGKTGILLAVYPDGSKDCVVKLDRFKGMREVKTYPLLWVGKRIGEQDPDDVFLIPRRL